MGAPWRLTTGVEPGAVKAASPVLNGGREETYSNVTRLAPTQPGFRRRLKRGVRTQSVFLHGGPSAGHSCSPLYRPTLYPDVGA